jgi:hypothetical protein
MAIDASITRRIMGEGEEMAPGLHVAGGADVGARCFGRLVSRLGELLACRLGVGAGRLGALVQAAVPGVLGAGRVGRRGECRAHGWAGARLAAPCLAQSG